VHRVTSLMLSAALCAAPLAASASPPDKPAAAPYKAPRTAFGQPDLTGFWSNATLTPFTRPAKLGDRAAYTEDEAKRLEATEVANIKEADAPTDPNAPPEAGKLDLTKVRPEFAAAAGDTGGYNRGWLEPGQQVMRVRGEPRTSILTTANGQIPPRKGAPSGGGSGRRRGAGAYDNPENRPLGERCVIGFGSNAGPPMLSNGFYNNNYQILQTPDAVVIDVEMNHDLRVVRLNGKHRTDGQRPYFGDSIGHWEGDTLVVETTNIPRSQDFAGSWENLKVTERFTRVAKDRIAYAFTLEDPTLWEKPWGGEYEFTPLHGMIYEYACHEGNYSLPGVLGGARAQERDAAAKAGGQP
jgi:hypothetical protein